MDGLRASPKICHILLSKSCDLPTLKIICQVKNSSISNSLLFRTWRNEKKGNRQHASREKTLFSWSVCSMQAGRGFAKPFSKLPYMRGEGGFLPSCHILPSCLPNCWRGVLSVLAKNQGCQLHSPNCWRCSVAHLEKEVAQNGVQFQKRE